MNYSSHHLPFEPMEIAGSIPDRFETVARLVPDRVAVATDDVALTYAELDRQANRLAHAILARTVAPEAPVTLLFYHDQQTIVAILAVLKAGRSYTALRSTAPTASLFELMAMMQTDLILTDQSHLALARTIAEQAAAKRSVQILAIDRLDELLPDTPPQRRMGTDDLMGVFFTTGTTGRPKGVMRTHRYVLHSAQFEGATYAILPDDRGVQFYHAAYGASSTDIFMTLLNGAALLPKDGVATPPLAFLNWVKRNSLTILRVSPSYLRACLDTLDGLQEQPLPGHLASLRIVVMGGAPIYRPDIERLSKYTGENCLFSTPLGLTETGSAVVSTFTGREIPNGDRIPVGFPSDGYEIELLDDNRRPVSSGEVGEIAIRSPYLALGYWRQPDLTAQRFLPDPAGGDRRIYLSGDLGRFRADGILEHLGRKDSMVKIRGYRVETEAVEQALLRAAGVDQAVVIAQDMPGGETRLVAYFVYPAQPAPTTSVLRQALAQTLPDYMIPAVFIRLDSLPLTPNGKVDSRALPPPPSSRPDLATSYAPPSTPTEILIAGIWAEVLGLVGVNGQTVVGVNDSFLDLGGNSILAAAIISRVMRAQSDLAIPAWSISATDLFAAPTVAAMAAILERQQTEAVAASGLEQLLIELESLPDADAALLLAAEKRQATS